MRNKASLNLSINMIVIVVLAVVLLGLMIPFARVLFGKSAVGLEQQASFESEPAMPTQNEPLTLSRDKIRIGLGNQEALRISILNPTDNDWVFSDYKAEEDVFCGDDNDGVCYVDKDDTTNTCSTLELAKINDNDCTNLAASDGVGGCADVNVDNICDECVDDNPDICVIDNRLKADNTYYCYDDPDCAPSQGIILNIQCSNIKIKKRFTPRSILAGKVETFTVLLEIIEGSSTDLCNVLVSGTGTGQQFVKDFILEVS